MCAAASAPASTPVKASDVPLPLDQAAFHDLVTVRSMAEAPEVFAKWGIVRVPNFLSPEEVDTLLGAAKEHGVRRTAFAQGSQADRYTLWIDGDGMTKEQTAATQAIKAKVPFIERALYRGDEESWRPLCDKFGYPNMMLAEIVTARPGGAPQGWHFDGEGITAQISLVPIGPMNGPTEIQPRPVPRAYMQWMKHLAENPPSQSGEDMGEVLEELTAEIKGMYDRLTMAHEFAWKTLRPVLGNNKQVARALIESGLTPPMVHMVADMGCLTLYDAAMIHRGGLNRDTEERPILAVHINKDNKEQRANQRQQELTEGLGSTMKKAGAAPGRKVGGGLAASSGPAAQLDEAPGPGGAAAAPGLTVAALKTELQARGLPTSGRKADLVARLAEAQDAPGSPPADDGPAPAAAVSGATPSPGGTTSPAGPKGKKVVKKAPAKKKAQKKGGGGAGKKVMLSGGKKVKRSGGGFGG